MSDPEQGQRSTVRAGYDRLADAYLAERDGSPPEVPLVVQFLDELDPGARLLDAGCGQGTPVLSRVPTGITAVGVDFSAAQLEHARRRTAAQLVQGDLTALPLAETSIDAITALHSIIHVPTEEHPAVYHEFARVLRPAGRLYLTASSDAGWEGANDDWLGSDTRMEWSFPAIEATRRSLRAAGFQVTRETRIQDTVSDEDDGGDWLHLFAEKQSQDTG